MWPFSARKKAPLQAAPSALLGLGLPDLPLSSQLQRIGGALTPIEVSSILREADGGRIARLVDLYHESRQKDCHMQSVLSACETDVTSLEWAVMPPKDATPREEEAAEAFADAWAHTDREAGIAHLVGESTAFGFAYDEVAWKLDGRLLVPAALKPVSCRRFGFNQATGALRFDRRGVGNVDIGGEDLLADYPAGKFVAVRRRINGDVGPREGLARCLIWAALGRNWSLRDWLTLGEIGWKPSVLTTFKKGSDKSDIEWAKMATERFTATGKLVKPDTIDVQIEWPKNAGTSTGGTHKEIEDYLAAEMSKAVLHGTLTIEAGTRGARSLGEVQASGRDGVRDTNVRIICDALTRQLAAPFTAYNYGPAVRPPTLTLVTEDKTDLQSFGLGVKALGDAGLRRIPAAWVRDQAGIPEAVGDEEVLDIPITVVEPGAEDDPEQTGDDTESDAA